MAVTAYCQPAMVYGAFGGLWQDPCKHKYYNPSFQHQSHFSTAAYTTDVGGRGGTHALAIPMKPARLTHHPNRFTRRRIIATEQTRSETIIPRDQVDVVFSIVGFIFV